MHIIATRTMTLWRFYKKINFDQRRHFWFKLKICATVACNRSSVLSAFLLFLVFRQQWVYLKLIVIIVNSGKRIFWNHFRALDGFEIGFFFNLYRQFYARFQDFHESSFKLIPQCIKIHWPKKNTEWTTTNDYESHLRSSKWYEIICILQKAWMMSEWEATTDNKHGYVHDK